jgi:hypothetical protein
MDFIDKEVFKKNLEIVLMVVIRGTKETEILKE